MKTRYFRYQALFNGLKNGKKQWYLEEGYIQAWTKKEARKSFEKNLDKYDLEHLVEVAFKYER